MALPKNFLWGGAVAAHQLEGAYDVNGRGLSVSDVMTGGSNKVARRFPGRESFRMATKLNRMRQV